MKRIILLLLCVLMLVGILVSCAKASDQPQQQTEQNETEGIIGGHERTFRCHLIRE